MGHLIRGGSSILHEGTTDARTIMPNAGNQNSDGVYSSREGTAIPLVGEHEPESRCIDTCGRCTLQRKKCHDFVPRWGLNSLSDFLSIPSLTLCLSLRKISYSSYRNWRKSKFYRNGRYLQRNF